MLPTLPRAGSTQWAGGSPATAVVTVPPPGVAASGGSGGHQASAPSPLSPEIYISAPEQQNRPSPPSEQPCPAVDVAPLDLRAAAVGGGCAAVKAKRESRSVSTAASPTASCRSNSTVDHLDKDGFGETQAGEDMLTGSAPGNPFLAAAAAAGTPASSFFPPQPAGDGAGTHGPLSISGDGSDYNTIPHAQQAGDSLRGSAAHGGGSVEVLQRMQQLLQSGMTPEMLQRWIAGQLQQSGKAAGGQEEAASTAPLPSAPATPGSNGDQNVAFAAPHYIRRPNSAVSVSLVSAQPPSEQGIPFYDAAAVTPVSPRLPGSAEEGPLVPTPPHQPPAQPLPVPGGAVYMSPSPPTFSSTESVSAVPGSRGAGGRKLHHAAASNPAIADLVSPKRVHASPGRHAPSPSSPADLPRSPCVPLPVAQGGSAGEMAATAAAAYPFHPHNSSNTSSHNAIKSGRCRSLSMTSPTTDSAAVPFGAAAPTQGGGLLMAPRTHASNQPQSPQQSPQPSWRSFSRGGAAAADSSLLGGGGGAGDGTPLRVSVATPADMPSPLSAMASYGAASFSQVNVPATRRGQDTTSALREVTKATIHAKRSELVGDEQRNIGLLLGERFSRRAEPLVRRLATPPSSRSTTLAVAAAAVVTTPTTHDTRSSGGGRRQSTCSAGDSCLNAAAYDRGELSTNNSQSRSFTLLKGVQTVPLSFGSNLQAVELPGVDNGGSSPGPLPYAARRASGDEVLASATTGSVRSTSMDLNCFPSSAGAVSPQATVTSLTGSGSAGSQMNHRPRVVSLHSSESAPTLLSSFQGTAGTLTCEQDALFPQTPPLPASAAAFTTHSLAAAMAAGRAQLAAQQQHQQQQLTIPVEGQPTPAPDTPLTLADGGEGLPTSVAGSTAATVAAGAAAAAEARKHGMSNVVSLLDVQADYEDDEATTATSPTTATTNTSADSLAASGAKAAPLADAEAQRRNSLRKWGIAAAAAPPQPRTTAAATGSVAGSAFHAASGSAATSPYNNASAAAAALLSANSSAAGVPASAQRGHGTLATHDAPADPLSTPVFQFSPQRGAQPTYTHVAGFVSNMDNNINNTNSGAYGNGHGNGASGRSFLSLGDDMQSFNSSRVSCVSGARENTLNGCSTSTTSHHQHHNHNRLRHSSVLHLSHASINGGLDPHMDGVMPDFVLDGAGSSSRRPGPRFLRTYCRHSPVHVTEDAVRAALAELEVPYVAGIDEASAPTNILTLMETHKYTDARAFYVVVCLNVLLRYNLVFRFAWDVKKLKRFLEVAATFFRDGNPYHHPVHATDVVLAAHQWLCEGTTAASLSDGEVAAFLLTALSIQLGHTGVDNRLLTQLRHPYAMLCSFASPQQGAIVSLVMALLRYPELHFFPDLKAPKLGMTSSIFAGRDVAAAEVAHEWTANRETELYDMLSELIMATDVRNHATLQQTVLRISQENWQRHGCLCSGAPAPKPYASFIASRSNRNRAGGAPPTATPRKFNASAASLNASAAATAGQHSSDGVCLNCCAYITENRVPDVLKAVLHFIDFSYLFRPHEIYVTGSVMYTAEVYRQSEVEYKMMMQQQERQRQQQQQQTEGGGEDGAVCSLTEPPVGPLPSSGGGGAGGFEVSPGDDAAAAEEATAALLSRSTHTQLGCQDDDAAAFASAVMGERQPWRQEVYRASTISSLQRRRSGDALAATASSAQPSRRTTAAAANDDSAAAAAGAATVVASGPGSPVRPWEPSETPSHDVTASDEFHSIATAAPPPTPPTLPPPSKPRRVQPLSGHGRDIVLICLEDLCLPFLEPLAPYLPESWVWATYLNHQTFMGVIPTAEEFDEVVNRLLDLAEESEEDIARTQADESGANIRSSAMPWLQLRRVCPCNSEWSVNKDGLVKRVIREVVLGTERLLDMDDA